MTKFKVLHVTFDMTIGGAQQVIRQLIENMDESQVHSDIVCIDNKLGELGDLLQHKGIKIFLLKRRPGFDITLIKDLYHLVKLNQYDIVHCHQYSPYVYGLLSSIFTSAKVVFTEHGRFYPDYGTWKRKLINPIFNYFTAQSIAISRATKDALIDFENFRSDSIDVVYNGIKDHSSMDIDENSLKDQFSIPKESLILGTISRLQPIKNQKMMISAFKKVHDEFSNSHLLIVGDGEIKQDLELLTQELSLTDCVTFTGFQNDPYVFHKIIDVFLLSSFSEGTSMTVLESMSFSKPCVLTQVGGNPEIITDGEGGYLVESDDVEQFSKRCLELLMSESLRTDMGHKARLSFEKSFRIKNMVTSYQNIYQNIL